MFCQTYKNFEIIFVDNASADDSVKFIEDNYKDSRLKIIKNNKNLGFAGGNNLGFQYIKGEYVVLLNNDVWVPRNYLEKFIKSFEEIPNLGSVQSKIVLMDKPDTLDTCGSYWTDFSFLYYYGHGKSQLLEKYNKSMPFFSNKGASMMIKKDIIDKIGLFDDDFWCYYEETDFCNRIWLAGYECWYYPKAVIYHAGGGTNLTFENDYIQFHNFKNKLLSFLKNFEFFTLVRIIPLFLFMNIILSCFWLLQGKTSHFFAIYKAIWWNILNFKKTLGKREIIQSMRKKSDNEIFSKTKKNPRLSYYYHLFKGLENYEE